MTTYKIEALESWETIAVKTADEMREWIKKYNVTDKDGNKVDIRKANGGMVVRVNGQKLLRVYRR